MTLERPLAGPNSSNPEIPWPAGVVKPDVIDRIRAEGGSILEAVNSITSYAILKEKNPIPSHVMAIDAGRLRFHQLYTATQQA